MRTNRNERKIIIYMSIFMYVGRHTRNVKKLKHKIKIHTFMENLSFLDIFQDFLIE